MMDNDVHIMYWVEVQAEDGVWELMFRDAELSIVEQWIDTWMPSRRYYRIRKQTCTFELVENSEPLDEIEK